MERIVNYMDEDRNTAGPNNILVAVERYSALGCCSCCLAAPLATAAADTAAADTAAADTAAADTAAAAADTAAADTAAVCASWQLFCCSCCCPVASNS